MQVNSVRRSGSRSSAQHEIFCKIQGRYSAVRIWDETLQKGLVHVHILFKNIHTTHNKHTRNNNSFVNKCKNIPGNFGVLSSCLGPVSPRGSTEQVQEHAWKHLVSCQVASGLSSPGAAPSHAHNTRGESMSGATKNNKHTGWRSYRSGGWSGC